MSFSGKLVAADFDGAIASKRSGGQELLARAPQLWRTPLTSQGGAKEHPSSLAGSAPPPRIFQSRRAGLKSQLLLGDRRLSISSAVVAKGLWCPAKPRVGSNSDTVSLVSSSTDVWLLDLEGEKIP